MSGSHPVRVAHILCRACWSDQVEETPTTLRCLECGQTTPNVLDRSLLLR